MTKPKYKVGDIVMFPGDSFGKRQIFLLVCEWTPEAYKKYIKGSARFNFFSKNDNAFILYEINDKRFYHTAFNRKHITRSNGYEIL